MTVERSISAASVAATPTVHVTSPSLRATSPSLRPISPSLPTSRWDPIRASAPMATGEYREEQPNGYYFDEPCEVRQIVAVPSGGFAVTFMKAFKFSRLELYGRVSVGG